MPAYIVRYIEDKEIVGVFVAPNLDELALLVDQATDPGVCETAKLGSGGIMWTGWEDTPKVPPASEADKFLDLSNAQIDDYWGSRLMDEKLRWSPVEPPRR